MRGGGPATSAAPTYFPSYDGFIDGGVVANNPSVAALAEALHEKSGNQKLEDIRLLSVGTGRNSDFLPGKTHDWGMVRWAPYLATIMIDGEVGMANYECLAILGKHYCRINKWLENPHSAGQAQRHLPADRRGGQNRPGRDGSVGGGPRSVQATPSHCLSLSSSRRAGACPFLRPRRQLPTLS